jgi:hypothetical protein
MLLIGAAPLFAQEAEPAEIAPQTVAPRPPALEESEPDFEYKFGMRAFFGYEFVDHNETGEPDATGPGQQDAGFWMERVFVNFDAKVNEGYFQGWRFNVTTDITPSGRLGDGCGLDEVCAERNESELVLRTAYVDAPLPFVSGLNLRMGIQDHPLSAAKAGYGVSSIWQHRYVERSHLQEAGLNEPVDRGVSLIHKTDYTGLHLFLSNGEGFRRTNAQSILREDIGDLARGAGDSYGLQASGMASLIPTGKDGTVTWFINLPFQFDNVVGMSDTEFRRNSVDITGTSPRFIGYFGDSRAKRDYTYGLTTALIWRTLYGELTIGGGAMQTVDQRANAYRLDQAVLNGVNNAGQPLSASDFSDYVRLESDSPGFMRYLYFHYRYAYFGVFGRYIYQTQTTRLRRQLQTVSGKSWAQQALELDAANGTIGDLGFNTARAGIDTTLGRVRNITYGFTFFPSPRSRFFRVSVGMSEIRGTDQTGREFRRSTFDTISGDLLGTPQTLTAQLENDTSIKAQFGIPANDRLILNDFIGRQQINREIWIRGEFRY